MPDASCKIGWSPWIGPDSNPRLSLRALGREGLVRPSASCSHRLRADHDQVMTGYRPATAAASQPGLGRRGRWWNVVNKCRNEASTADAQPNPQTSTSPRNWQGDKQATGTRRGGAGGDNKDTSEGTSNSARMATSAMPASDGLRDDDGRDTRAIGPLPPGEALACRRYRSFAANH